MLYQMNLWVTDNAISLPVLESGPWPFSDPTGLPIEECGQARALVNLSPRQAKEQDLLTSGTYGPRFSISSESMRLKQCLVNKLRQKVALDGSILYKLTWKEKVTPSGRPVYALLASGRSTSGKGYGGLPTPCAREGHDWSQAKILARLDKGDGTAKAICNRSLSLRSSQEIVGLHPSFARWMMRIPPEWEDSAPTETPSTLKRLSSSLTPTSKQKMDKGMYASQSS